MRRQPRFPLEFAWEKHFFGGKWKSRFWTNEQPVTNKRPTISAIFSLFFFKKKWTPTGGRWIECSSCRGSYFYCWNMFHQVSGDLKSWNGRTVLEKWKFQEKICIHVAMQMFGSRENLESVGLRFSCFQVKRDKWGNLFYVDFKFNRIKGDRVSMLTPKWQLINDKWWRTTFGW